MDYRLMDFKGEMGALREKVEKHARPYAELPEISKGLKEIQEIYAAKLDATKPEVMVFGIYNAGKSSIINELIGADRAKVEDVPTTDKVDYYEWNGYRLADTPGVGAPIEHQNVTMEHLKKADVVIFVMSTTGSNERRQNYVRMKEIADAGKKIIIVLNDKNGDLFSENGDRTIQTIKDKVAENMRQVGIENVEKKYYIVAVNAARAKKGREKGSQAFLDKSNMAELTNVIMQELKKTGPFHILSNAIQDVERALQPMIVCLAEQDKEEGVKSANELLEKLRIRRKELREEMAASIDVRADRLGHKLPGMIWSLRKKPAQVQEQVQAEVAKTAEMIQQDFENRLHELTGDLLEDAEDLTLEIEKLDFKASDMQVDVVPDMEERESSFDVTSVLNRVKDVLGELNEIAIPSYGNNGKGGNALANTALGMMVSKGVKQAAGTALGKSLLATALGKSILVPVMPYVGVITAVLPLLDSLFGGKDNFAEMQAEAAARNEREKRRIQAEAQAREELAQKCMYMAADLADNFKIAIDSSLQVVAEEIAKPFKEESKRMKRISGNLQTDLNALREAADSYNALQNKFRSVGTEI